MSQESQYNDEIGDQICAAVATTGASLKDICKQHPHFPQPGTIYKWRNKFPKFDEKYTQAKRKQVDVLVDQILSIADDGHNDTYVDDEGNVKTNIDVVNRARLRVDTRKWIAAKLAPKIYGTNPFEIDVGKTFLESILPKLS